MVQENNLYKLEKTSISFLQQLSIKNHQALRNIVIFWYLSQISMKKSGEVLHPKKLLENLPASQ